MHDGGRTSQQIQQSVEVVISAMAPKPGVVLAADTDLRAGLGYSSLRLIELMITLEEYLSLPPIDLAEAGPVRTVADVIQLAVEAAAVEAAAVEAAAVVPEPAPLRQRA